MIKRILVAVLICSLFAVCFPSIATNADIIFMPQNDFFEDHKNECVPVERTFYFPGGISLRQEPGSKNKVKLEAHHAKLLTSKKIYVNYAYTHKGEIWGFIEHVEHGLGFSGWVLMDKALLVYDEISFMKDNKASFYNYPGGNQAIKEKLASASSIIVWKWPLGEKSISYESTENYGQWKEVTRTIDNKYKYYDNLFVSYFLTDAYNDGQGREWIRIIDYSSFSNRYSYWICVSDPETENIPTSIPSPRQWKLEDFSDDSVYVAEKCFREANRFFSPDSPDGFVSVKENPGSAYEVSRIENGTYTHIYVAYIHEGKLWGAVENGEKHLRGWVLMDGMAAEYDYKSFEEEYGASFYHIDNIDKANKLEEEIKKVGKVVLWSWPGSGMVRGILHNEDINKLGFFYSDAYKDSEGKEWIFDSFLFLDDISYYNVWICVSDPDNEDIPVFSSGRRLLTSEEIAPSKADGSAYSPKYDHIDGNSSNGIPPALLMIIILVCGVIISSVVLILVFWRPGKKEKEENTHD